MVKLRIEGLPSEIEKTVDTLTDNFLILNESRIYPNRNSQFVRKYLEVESFDFSAIIIDTETTGLNPAVDEIFQLSILDKKGNTVYNSYFLPEKVASWEDAEKINHITPNMVKYSPKIRDEIHKINVILSHAKEIIGYNLIFDLEFLAAAGAVWAAEEFYDVMREFAKIYGEWSEVFDDFKWQKLTTCANYYKYDWESDTAHDSLADCRATLFCYNKIKDDSRR